MFNRIQAAVQARSTHKSARLPAPVRGLIRNENIALAKPDGATILENFFPTSTGIETRRGKRKHATLTGSTPVGAIMPYVYGNTGKLFAANDAGIYDCTNPATPTTVLTAASGIGTVTSGAFSYCQFSTSGGDFLICVNGTNLHKTYSGSAWAENSPAITGTTSDNFNHVWAFKERLFFNRKNSLKFYYLSVSTIGGAVSEFNLGPVFSRGGYLVSGGTWSTDAGDGVDDLCWFLTSEGEVAVYNGDDPGDAERWVLQGVYRVGKPLGKRAIFRAGGDVGIATRDGLVPMSGAYARAIEALRDTAVSKPIEELWTEYTSSRNTLDWHVQTFTGRHSMLWVAPPTITGQQPLVLVANMRTGAWTVYTGYNVRSMGQLGNSLYCGDATSVVYEAETGGADDGANYVAKAAGSWNDLKAPMDQKRVTMLRGTFRHKFPNLNPQWSIGTDYTNAFPSPPTAGQDISTALWGTATWGGFTWGGATAEYRESEWTSVEGVGHMISWQLQVTLGNTTAQDIELASVGLVFETGEVVG